MTPRRAQLRARQRRNHVPPDTCPELDPPEVRLARMRSYIERTHDDFMASMASADEWEHLEVGVLAGPIKRRS